MTYDRCLARKRMAASVLFFDEADRVLLVDPVYKPRWEVPGGAVDADESPRDAACREVKEELGMSAAPGRLLAVDWVPPRPERGEGMITVFDGGVLTGLQVAGIVLQAEELQGYRFVEVGQVHEYLTELLGRRVKACAAARRAGTTLYLENGSDVTLGCT
ncbi:MULTISPECIES: NUDIX hydrolase [Streptacidiphilus]|uniref:NUDIX domain-containing protein n=1 Tax=Streptacidiphilus cavernicola TaxID=3342716 RepID=A0ABV6UWF3_9ACTN|nr:NUDIX hydrolase [Streptacidiphilus jeojiense]